MADSGILNEDDNTFTVNGGNGPVTLPKMANLDLYNTIKATQTDQNGAGAVEESPAPAAYDPMAGLPELNKTATPDLQADGTPSLLAQPNVMNAPDVYAAPGASKEDVVTGKGSTTFTPDGREHGLDGQNPSAPIVKGKLGAGAMPGGARPQTTDETITKHTELGPLAVMAHDQYLAASNKSIAAEQKALQQQYKNQEYAASRQADTLDYQSRVATAALQRDNNIIADMRKDIDTRTQEYNDMSIDSHRIFGDGQTGNKVLAAIGLAMGAIGSGLAGKDYQSQVVGIIDKAIQRDVDIQKADIEKKGKVIDQKRGALHDFMEITKDGRAAQDAEFARQYARVGKEIDMYINSAKNSAPAVSANLAKMRSAVSEKESSYWAQYDNNVIEKKNSIVLKKMEPLPKDVSDQVGKMAVDLANTERLIKLNEDLHDTGWLAEHKQDLKARFGLAAPNETELMQLVDTHYAHVVEELAKSRGFAPTELPFFSKLVPNRHMNNETFTDALHRERKDILANAAIMPDKYPNSQVPDVVELSKKFQAVREAKPTTYSTFKENK